MALADLIQEGNLGLHEGRRALRLPPRLPVLDVRELVDPPRDQPRARRQGPRGSAAGAHDRRAASPDQGAPPAHRQARPPADDRGARRGDATCRSTRSRRCAAGCSSSRSRSTSRSATTRAACSARSSRTPTARTRRPTEDLEWEALTTEVRELLRELRPDRGGHPAPALRPGHRAGADAQGDRRQVQPVARAHPPAPGAGARARCAARWLAATSCRSQTVPQLESGSCRRRQVRYVSGMSRRLPLLPLLAPRCSVSLRAAAKTRSSRSPASSPRRAMSRAAPTSASRATGSSPTARATRRSTSARARARSFASRATAS